MSSFAANHPTLLKRFWPNSSLARNALICVAGSLLMVAAAKVKVPFWPVEMTMQTFAVMVIGMTMGWRLGGATIALYLAQGAAGLPVFTGTPEKGIGIAYMMGPTGGYLVGFLLAAMLVGWLAERGWDRSFLLAPLAMLAGLVAIYVPGLLHLVGLFGIEKPILEWGLYPFLAGEAFKMALAAAILPLAWKAAKGAGRE